MLPWCSYNIIGHGTSWLHTSVRSLCFLHQLGLPQCVTYTYLLCVDKWGKLSLVGVLCADFCPRLIAWLLDQGNKGSIQREHELLKVAKEHVTTMPLKYKLITYCLCTSVVEQNQWCSACLQTQKNCMPYAIDASLLQAMAEPRLSIDTRERTQIDKQRSS